MCKALLMPVIMGHSLNSFQEVRMKGKNGELCPVYIPQRNAFLDPPTQKLSADSLGFRLLNFSQPCEPQ